MARDTGSPLDRDTFSRALEQVQQAARAGARRVVDVDLHVREAEDRAVEKLEDAFLARKPIENPGAWGFRVGLHEALRLAGRKKTETLDEQSGRTEANADGEMDTNTVSPADVRQLRCPATGRCEKLSKTQRDVVEAVLVYRSLRVATKALGKDRSNVHRILKRALKTLGSCGIRERRLGLELREPGRDSCDGSWCATLWK